MAFGRQTVLCLMILACWPIGNRAEEFSQCANAEPDTFVMTIDDCAAYIYCNGEDSFRDSCPEDTYFDDKTQECVFDDAGVCLKGLETEEAEEVVEPEAEEVVVPSSTPDPTLSPTIPEVDTTAAAPLPSRPAGTRPHCDSNRDSVHPHPQRCEYFYRCVGGYLTIVRCPYDYGWDSPTEQCRPKAQANCFSL
ncbi:uncharacterized protein Dana_GF10954 [Drosophila ananassae]|uniref:Chitin-binding type-2 domain-containing protein n=1 Tax=Drosophila ananassae TaxID=7217 RepID=B3MAM1_DROAN|nr:uncharacterized protein LOC6493820 [Drosophila ananassae]EDV41308.1 uncharacterized protein Dana_GF10954 [Drosophila ananassae]